MQPDQLGTRYSDLALIKDTLLLRSNKVSLLSYHVARARLEHIRSQALPRVREQKIERKAGLLDTVIFNCSHQCWPVARAFYHS